MQLNMRAFDQGTNFLREHVYSAVSEIRHELKTRRENPDLRSKVRDFFKDNPLLDIDSEPRAILSRTIFTPNLEFNYFVDVAKDFNIKPLLLEYGAGKFVAKNPEKYHLCKLFFFDERGKNGGLNYQTKRIVDFNTFEGLPMKDLLTDWREPLTEFHHTLLNSQHEGMTENIMDFSDWFNRTRYLTNHYYYYFLSLFICNGVLFENYLINDKHESDFIKKNVLDSFARVTEYFGVKPLIYPLSPLESEQLRSWYSYTIDMKEMVDHHIRSYTGNAL
jgi:hypothetical protein